LSPLLAVKTTPGAVKGLASSSPLDGSPPPQLMDTTLAPLATAVATAASRSPKEAEKAPT
jgi:hypothetical protein